MYNRINNKNYKLFSGRDIGLDHAIQFYIGLDLGSSFGLVLPLKVSVCLDNAVYFGKSNKYNNRIQKI
jgi:hypothetical protein